MKKTPTIHKYNLIISTTQLNGEGKLCSEALHTQQSLHLDTFDGFLN